MVSRHLVRMLTGQRCFLAGADCLLVVTCPVKRQRNTVAWQNEWVGGGKMWIGLMHARGGGRWRRGEEECM